MIIEDYTLNKKFSELQVGTCFVMYSEYYMKLFIKYYDDYANKSITYKQYAVNLNSPKLVRTGSSISTLVKSI